VRQLSQREGEGNLNGEKDPRDNTLAIYLRLTDAINAKQAQLVWSEIVFIIIEIVVFFLSVFQIARLLEEGRTQGVGALSVAMVLMGLVIGMAVSCYWIAYAMRLQLRLKLRYFQARFLERKLGGIGEDIFSGNERFNKDVTSLESPDGEETVSYPKEGAMGMDGIFGGAKPRRLSWYMPLIFFILFATLFVRIVVQHVR
jgi:hypothetical protein